MRPVLTSRVLSAAMERSGGVVTPPHSTGIYFLFGFILFGVLVASRCSRLASFAACRAVCRAPFHSRLAMAFTCARTGDPRPISQQGLPTPPAAPTLHCEGRDPQRPIPWQTSDPPIGLMSRLSFWTTDPALLIRIPFTRSLTISVWVIQYEARSPQLSILF